MLADLESHCLKGHLKCLFRKADKIFGNTANVIEVIVFKFIQFSYMHKLYQRSLPLDPAGVNLKNCCNSTGAVQTVCLYKNRSFK